MSTIHLVSHTHWDREWYLTFQQFRLKLVHLIDRLLEILENDLEYKYFLLDGQAIILEDYLKIRPEREADLIRFIKNGRLLIGPWYISPDEFLVSPESHVRNLLEGNRLCHRYGAKMSVGYLPDTFGHIGQMPQILSGFGINAACLWRGLEDQPVELLWKSPDDSSVLLSYLRDSYSNAANLTTDDPERFSAEIQELGRTLSPFSSTGQILLMHGTDHMEPSMRLTSAIRAYRDKNPHDELIHSSLPLYFDAIRSQIAAINAELPVISGELRSSKHAALLQSVLSTRMTLKQLNHKCETDLVKWVEPLGVWAYLLEGSQPLPGLNHSTNNHPYLKNQTSAIQYAWKLLMQCHPHDSICGTSIDQVVKEMMVRFDQVDQINHELITQNLQIISQRIDTTYTGISRQVPEGAILSSIIVFNPNDQPQSGMINLNITLENRYSSFDILDDRNTIVPYHQRGLGLSELISMTLDKKGVKQGLGMVHEGNVAGMVIRDFDIEPKGNQAFIRITLSDHALVDLVKWKQGIAKLDSIFANPAINEFIIRAYSDPEVDLSFVARDIPGHGYRCYWIRAGIKSEPTIPRSVKINPIIRGLLPAINLISRIPFVTQLLLGKKRRSRNKNPKIENDYFVLEANVPDGSLAVTDKRTAQVYHGLNRFIDGGDTGDLYNYCPPKHEQFITSRMTGYEREQNTTCQKLIIHSELKLPKGLSPDRVSRSRESIKNRITSIITLVPGVPRIDIHTHVDNQSSDHRLRVHFPAPFSCSMAYHDGHYELVERPIGVQKFDALWEEQPRPEVPQRQFTLVCNGRASLTIANRGLPEVEVMKNQDGNSEISLTLLRCVGWLSRDDLITRKGHAGPMGIATPGAQMIDLHEFDYSIIPGDNHKLASIHQAYLFNAPLRAINAPVHHGPLPSRLSLIKNFNANFIITTIKLGEDGSGLIVRGYNLLPTPIEADLIPYRIFHQAHLVNMQEEQIEPLSITSQGQLQLQIGGNKIISVHFCD